MNTLEIERVQSALRAILNDNKFQTSPQMSSFLEYVVQQTLLGNHKRIKAYTVAVEALGKPPEFDAQDDPSVRVMAKRLRETLIAYNHGNPSADVIIQLHTGSYVPLFQFRDNTEQLSTIGSAISDAASASLQASNGKHSIGDPMAGNRFAANSTFDNLRDGFFEMLASPFARASVLLTLLLGVVTYSLHKKDEPLTAEHAHTTQDHTHGITGNSFALANVDINPDDRSRPGELMVFLHREPDRHSLKHALSLSASKVLSRFAGVQVVYTDFAVNQASGWPEEFQLHIDSLNLGDQRQVNLQLLQASSGKVIYAQSVPLSNSSENSFSGKQEQDVFDEAVAQIAQLDGPLMANYFKGSDIVPNMHCHRAIHLRLHANRHIATLPLEPFIEKCQAAIDEQLVHKNLETQFRIVNITESEPLADAGKQQAAVMEAKALALALYREQPYSGFGQLLLMRTLQLTGHAEKARLHGELAISLNPFSGCILRNVALAMNAGNENTGVASRWFSQADKVDPYTLHSYH